MDWKKKLGLVVIFELLFCVAVQSMLLNPVVMVGASITYQYDVYPVDSSLDDVLYVVDYGDFYGATNDIFVKTSDYDVIVGVRFDDVVFPSGVGVIIDEIYLSVYVNTSESSIYENVPVSIYGIEDESFGSFDNYTYLDSMNISSSYVNWDVDDELDMINNGCFVNVTLFGEYSSQNIFDGGDLDNGDLGVIMYGSRLVGHGPHYFGFKSFDWNGTDNSPRLVVVYHERSTPAGVPETSTFIEEYRGYDVWRYRCYDWLDYSLFTLVNPDSNIAGLNETYFTYTTYYEDDDDYLRRVFSDSGLISRRFGITYTEFHDNTGVEAGNIMVHWGMSDSAGPVSSWTDGYSIGTYQDAGGGNREKLELYVYEGGVLRHTDTLHPYWINADLPATIWIDVSININTGVYNVTIYNDEAMTSMNATSAGTFGTIPLAGNLNWEFAVGPAYSNSANRDYESGIRHGNIYADDYYIVKDGVLIDVIEYLDYDDYEDVREEIRTLTSPWYFTHITDIIGIVGLVCLVLAPTVGLYIAKNGDVVNGFIYALSLFITGYAFILVWLT